MEVGVSRQLWRTYRSTAAFGVLLGGVVGVLLLLMGGGDGRIVFNQTVLGSIAGAATAVIGCFGAFLALRRAMQRNDRSRSLVNAGAAGAGTAVLVVWLSLGLVASITERSAVLLMVFLPIAIIAGVAAWVLSGFALHWHESRRAVQPKEPPEA